MSGEKSQLRWYSLRTSTQCSNPESRMGLNCLHPKSNATLGSVRLATWLNGEVDDSSFDSNLYKLLELSEESTSSQRAQGTMDGKMTKSSDLTPRFWVVSVLVQRGAPCMTQRFGHTSRQCVSWCSYWWFNENMKVAGS